MQNEFKLSDLRSGYLVEFRNGRRAIVARAGNFTKVLVNPNSNTWWYLNSGWHDRTLNAKFMYPTNHEQTPRRGKAREWDIVRVYGLIRGTAAYGLALAIDSTSERPLLWGRMPAVKMTVSQICEKLGYDIMPGWPSTNPGWKNITPWSRTMSITPARRDCRNGRRRRQKSGTKLTKPC